jgi:hypothetical protein
MKSFKSYIDAKEKLGPDATKSRDKMDITRQKMNLDRLTKEYHGMSKDEGGGGMAKAHGDMFANAKKNIKEDGGAAGAGAGAVSVAAVAGSGDSRLPTSQREPGVSKKHNPVMKGLAKRKLPNM